MTSEGSTREVINIVLQERSFFLQTERIQRPLQDPFTGTVVSHHIEQPHAFGSRVFDVSHVYVDTARVEQEPSVTGGFIATSIVDIDDPDPFRVENVVFDLDRYGIRANEALMFGSHTPVFGLEAKNAANHIEHQKCQTQLGPA